MMLLGNQEFETCPGCHQGAQTYDSPMRHHVVTNEAGQRTGRANEQDALRDAGADGREALGTLEELHNLHAMQTCMTQQGENLGMAEDNCWQRDARGAAGSDYLHSRW